MGIGVGLGGKGRGDEVGQDAASVHAPCSIDGVQLPLLDLILLPAPQVVVQDPHDCHVPQTGAAVGQAV